MSLFSSVQNSSSGVSPRAVKRCREINDAADHPFIKVLQVEKELERLGLELREQALLNVLLAKLLLADPNNASVDKSTFGRGEEGSEVTMGRHPSTTPLLRASSCLGLAGIHKLKEKITSIAFRPTEPHLEEIYSALIS